MIPIRAYISLLSRYLAYIKGRISLLAGLALGGIGLQLVLPQLIAAFIDRAVGGSATDQLIPLALWFLGAAVLRQLLSVATTWLAEDIGWRTTNELRSDLMRHVVDLDMGFHKEYTPGELIERVDGDVTALSELFSAFVVKVVGNGLLVIGILVLITVEHVIVGLVLTVFAVTTFAVMVAVQSVAIPWWKDQRASSAELMGFVGEQLTGTEDIRANGGVTFMVQMFNGILRRWLPRRVRARFGFAMLWGTGIIHFIVGTTLVMWLGARYFGQGALTLGGVYLIFHYTEMTRNPMDEIRSQMEVFQKAGAGISRVGELLQRESKLRASGSTEIPQGALSVTFEGLSFAYSDSDAQTVVLHDLDLTISPGRVVGVLGRSGSGKSTMAKLLTRLYDPTEGRVLLGGIDTRDTSLRDLRHRVGMVTQDVQLFRTTVRNNLTFFDATIDDDRLLSVMNDLGLREWLASLPDGLDTMLESGAGGLSAGQAQLLAFTRIFLKDPGLVILDEASSRLDPATEAMIERAVAAVVESRTAFVIAHHLGTVARADDIMIVENGSLVEFGAREVLQADPTSRFSRLLESGMEEVLA
jgi:ATP-binding cassette, subfamily B, bacterial